MKKGSIHIDWAISLGIFTIALLAMFVFLRPGVKEINSEDVLLDLVQTNFETEVIWSVEKIPLYVHELESTHALGDPKVVIEVVGSAWEVSTYEPQNYVPQPGSHFTFAQTENNVQYELDCTISTCSTNNGPIYIIFSSNSRQHGPLELYSPICSMVDGCDAELGVSEVIDGISPQWLNELAASDYNDVRTAWGFPDNRNFALFEGQTKFFGKDTPENVNTFVRVGKYWLLNADGTRVKKDVSFVLW